MFTKLRIVLITCRLELVVIKDQRELLLKIDIVIPCTSKNIEDEMHFVCDCELYKSFIFGRLIL